MQVIGCIIAGKNMPNKNISFDKIAVFLAGLGGCVAFGWQVFKGTPRYSLSQLKTAIQASDRQAIQEYIDSEAISTQIVDTAIEIVQQQSGTISDNIFGQLGASIGREIMGTIRPIMEQQIEQYLDQAIFNSSDIKAETIKLVAITSMGEGKAMATFDISQIPNSEKLEQQYISVILEQQKTKRWRITGLSSETLEMFAKLASSKN